MSPNTERLTPMELRFPRVSGDEPRAAQAGGPDTLFSPRERG